MSPDVITALNRITSFTSVIRTRLDDDTRAQVHGGSAEEIATRARALATRLNAVADELEKAIA